MVSILHFYLIGRHKRQFDIDQGLVRPLLSSCLLIMFIHFSKAVLILKSTSLTTVMVQTSNVLSPATFQVSSSERNINYVDIRCRQVSVIMNLMSSLTPFHHLLNCEKCRKVNNTFKRLGRAPPPLSLDLKSSNVLVLKILEIVIVLGSSVN